MSVEKRGAPPPDLPTAPAGPTEPPKPSGGTGIPKPPGTPLITGPKPPDEKNPFKAKIPASPEPGLPGKATGAGQPTGQKEFSKRLAAGAPRVELPPKEQVVGVKQTRRLWVILVIVVIVVGLVIGGLYGFQRFTNFGGGEESEITEIETVQPPVNEENANTNANANNNNTNANSNSNSSVDILDSDGDGLSDNEELLEYNTDPDNPDTDGDGYGDGEEVDNGYNPNGSGKLNSSANSAS